MSLEVSVCYFGTSLRHSSAAITTVGTEFDSPNICAVNLYVLGIDYEMSLILCSLFFYLNIVMVLLL